MKARLNRKLARMRMGRTWRWAALLLLAIPAAVQAGDFNYTTNSPDTNTVTITGYTGLGGAVAIPSNIVDKTVTAIGDWALSNGSNLTSVVIPNSVTHIGISAFGLCSNLTSVVIPDSVVYLGGHAFQYCSSMTNATIGAGVTNIRIATFIFCTNLTSVVIPAGVNYLGDEVFAYCSGLTNVAIGTGVNNIGSKAFIYCTNLTSVVIPESVTRIGDLAFYATHLASVAISANVTNIGERAFAFCMDSLVGVYFKGNAPSHPSPPTRMFENSQNAIVYYVPGKTGWPTVPNPWPPDGRPTALWRPEAVGGAGFGVQANQFGFDIRWASASGMPFVVEACTNLAEASWSPLQTIIPGGDLSHFSDPHFANSPIRAYRLHAPGMVWIEGGDVELGQVEIAEPVHTNFISGFWMDETEVTKALWDVVAGWAVTNGYDISAGGGSGKAINHPVQRVTWYEAVKWCNARSQMEGLAPCYYTSAAQSTIYTTGTVDVPTNGVDWSANGYRLPTEAEWEKAARGGLQGNLFPWGDTIQHARANYCSRTNEVYDTSPTRGYHPAYNDGVEPYTSSAGSFPANGYGLHDMAGNVWEWCWDWNDSYEPGSQTDPHGPASSPYGARVLRGGSWYFFAYITRCAYRDSYDPGSGGIDLGFRCARGP